MKSIALCVVLTASRVLASDQVAKAEKSYPDPERLADAIARFEKADSEQAPPTNAIVCIGSSRMRGWQSWAQCGTLRY